MVIIIVHVRISQKYNKNCNRLNIFDEDVRGARGDAKYICLYKNAHSWMVLKTLNLQFEKC